MKFAFIKLGSFSHTNEKVLEALKNEFPNYEVDVIDVNNLILRKNLMCLLIAFFQYGKGIIIGDKELMKCRTRTAYYMKKARKVLLERLSDKNYVFTFQTQSLFDASIPGVPHFLYTDHTHLVNLTYPSFNQKKLYSQKWTEIEKQVYQNATINFTMSTHVSNSIMKQYNVSESAVKMVRCGSHLVAPKNLDIFSDRYSSKNILFVGIDWERKGGPELIAAFEKVLEAHPDAQLTIVGCKPNIALENVNVIGVVPLDEVAKYYLSAAVFCLPTKREPFGIVFLEAFANQLPIVSTNIGALPDIVQDGKNGYLVDCNDIQALSEKLINLLNDPDKCRNFGIAGYITFLEKYTWNKTAKTMAYHMNKVLGKVN